MNLEAARVAEGVVARTAPRVSGWGGPCVWALGLRLVSWPRRASPAPRPDRLAGQRLLGLVPEVLRSGQHAVEVEDNGVRPGLGKPR